MKTRQQAILIALTGRSKYTMDDLEDDTKIGVTLLSDLTILEDDDYINTNCPRCDNEPPSYWLTVKGQITVHEHNGDINNGKRQQLLNGWRKDLKVTRLIRCSAIILVINTAMYLAYKLEAISSTTLQIATITAATIWITWGWRIARNIDRPTKTNTTEHTET